MSSPTYTGTSPTFPGALSGGGGGNPDLVTGGAPVNGSQAKASGTTSSDAITFQAPTGGSGSSTPSAALAHVVGTGAGLSGSGLGGYTVTGLEDGDVVTVTCTHTDDGDGQVVKDVAVVSVAAAAGATYPDNVLDWSSSSETFASGEGAYTIGGLSVTLSYNGGAGPDSLSITNGLIAADCTSGGEAFLIVDLGEDVSAERVIAYLTCTNLGGGSGGWALLKVSANATVGHAANQAQYLIGTSGTATALRSREANGAASFATANDHTVTDVTTTPTRVAIRCTGPAWDESYDQGSAAMPTTGAMLGTVGSNRYNDGSGAVASQDRRYVHLHILRTGDYRLGAAILRTV